METFIEIIKQIGVAVATIFLACPIFILFFIEYIESWDKKKQNNKNEIEKIQKEREINMTLEEVYKLIENASEI